MVSATLRRQVRSVVEEKAARHLHRDRAAALHARPVAQVRPRRAQNSHGIESGMLEETPVLDRKHGIAQHLRNVVEAHGPALLARAVEQAGQQLRFDLGRIQSRAAIQRADLLHLIAAEIDNEPVLASKVGFAGRANLDFIAVQNVAPGRARNIQLTVAGALQVICQFPGGECLARWRSAWARRKSGPWSAGCAPKGAGRSSGHRKSSNTLPRR